MRRSLQSYTPTVSSLNYDALQNRVGCEADTGNDWLNSLAFSQVCVFEHNDSDLNFNQSDLVSYSVGPAITGVATKPFTTIWAAWVGTTGVRIDDNRGFILPPSESIGVADTLYEFTKPTKLSHCFAQNALLHIAIQKTATSIELKRYTDTAGTIATLSWEGVSPVMFNAGILATGSPTLPDAAVYYLKPETPTKLYGRFAEEAFATERVVMPDMRVSLKRLVGSWGFNFKHYLYAIDDEGRDVTLSTKAYPLTATEKVTVTLGFESGGIFDSIEDAAIIATEKVTVTLAFYNGFLYDATAETAAVANEKTTVTLGFENGEMQHI